MAELTYREAVAAGLAQELERDENVVFLGEDVAEAGGVFKTTVGLLEQFGPTLKLPRSGGWFQAFAGISGLASLPS